MIEAISKFIDENKDFIEFTLYLAYRNKIDELYLLNGYQSKVNYYIDKNEVNFNIKKLRERINNENKK